MLFREAHRRRARARAATQLREVHDRIGRGEFDLAFEQAERLLDANPDAETYEGLLRPIDPLVRGPAYDRYRLYELLEQLEVGADANHRPWRTLLRFALLERLEWQEEAFNISGEFRQLPPRYAWMRYNRAAMLMNRLWAFGEARHELEATLQAAPAFWKAGAMLAECSLCQGREPEAFATMDRCIAELKRRDQPSNVQMARTWRGELHLWIGRYHEALDDLAAGPDEEPSYALCWNAAAHLLLGDPDRALRMVHQALQSNPSDAEAHVWRGEICERLGDWELAIADFDRAATLTGMPLWPRVGHALAKAGKGDLDGVLADFDSLPGRITNFFQWKTRTRVGGNPANAVIVLKRMRSEARGLRRGERYLEPLWMRRPAAPS